MDRSRKRSFLLHRLKYRPLLGTEQIRTRELWGSYTRFRLDFHGISVDAVNGKIYHTGSLGCKQCSYPEKYFNKRAKMICFFPMICYIIRQMLL